MSKPISSNIQKQTFPVTGMSCAACATRVNKTLNQQEGVCSASVNYAAATVTIEYDTRTSSAAQLKRAVQDAGYDLLIDTEKDTEQEAEEIRHRHYRQLKRRTLWAILWSVPISIIAMGFHTWQYAGVTTWLLSTPVVFVLGRDFFIQAWKQLRHKTSNMDTLVATSTGIAYLFSLFNLLFPEFWTARGLTPHLYFETAAMIIAFILLGRTLEERAKGQTSEAIRQLMGLQPKHVTVVREGKEQKIPIRDILTGDTVVVKPGERIAVDGTVTEGASYVDESMLSGEPLAVRKQQGSKVFAGTINQKGSFCFRADEVGSQTMLAHIIRMVQEAQGSKAPVQKLVDKIAAVFVPVILSTAVLTFVLWMILAESDGFTHGLMAAVTVLIIACPCALGLATPTAIMVGMGRGAGLGILIKDAESLEIARKVDTLILDKTGTLTEGKPVTSDWEWNNESEEMKSVLYTMEKHSEHPLAAAIVEGLQKHIAQQAGADVSAIPEVILEEFESLTGRGVSARYQDKEYLAGNLRMIQERNIPLAANLLQTATQWEQEAKTVVWLACEGRIAGIVAVSDRIKPTSAEAVTQLRKRGIEVVMLTGDNRQTAAAIAAQVGIATYQAEVLPQQKAEWVKKYQAEGRTVAMAGDGINDSAALAQADLSIAMGQGSDIAMSVAKMTLISSDLTKIATAITLSAETVRTIRQNLFWAFIYNLIGVPLAAGILYPINGFLLDPMIAGAAMAMSSVSVVTNSLRLRKKKIVLPTVPPQEPTLTPQSQTVIEYQVEGMMCNHCRMRVEKALNSLEQAEAAVSLNPPVARLTYRVGAHPLNLEELQNILTEKAGEYTISEK